MTGKKAKNNNVAADDVLSSDDEREETRPRKTKEGAMDRFAESAGVDTSSIQIVDVNMFESYTLLLSAIGALEFGFAYATIFVQIIMAVAFSEMVKL